MRQRLEAFREDMRTLGSNIRESAREVRDLSAVFPGLAIGAVEHLGALFAFRTLGYHLFDEFDKGHGKHNESGARQAYHLGKFSGGILSNIFGHTAGLVYASSHNHFWTYLGILLGTNTIDQGIRYWQRLGQRNANTLGSQS